MLKRRALLLLLVCLSGCGGTDVSGYRTLPLDEDVVVGVGEKMGITGDGVTELEIKSIRDDSRCPVNAECVWAGTAFAVLELHKKPRLASADAPPPETLSIEYLKDNTTTLTVRPRYKIAFIQLKPEAQLGKIIAQDDYRITLHLTGVSP